MHCQKYRLYTWIRRNTYTSFIIYSMEDVRDVEPGFKYVYVVALRGTPSADRVNFTNGFLARMDTCGFASAFNDLRTSNEAAMVRTVMKNSKSFNSCLLKL